MRQHLLGAMKILCLVLLPSFVVAQPINYIAPTLPQISLAPTPSGMSPLSTAMIECPLVGTVLTAIVYSDNQRTYLYMDLGYGASSQTVVVADKPSQSVDVAIGDDPLIPGEVYRVGLALRHYDIGAGTFELALKQFPVKVIPNVSIGTASGQSIVMNGAPIPVGVSNFRIDAVAGTTSLGPFPFMRQFMVLFSDANDELMINTFPTNDITTIISSFGPFAGYWGKDIAASMDVSTGMAYACIAAMPAVPSPSNMAYVEVNMVTLAAPTPQFLFPGDPYDPRIEAYGQYDPSAGYAKWSIITREDFQRIYLYSDINPTGYYCNPSQFDPTYGTSQEYPTIAAGIGPVWGSNIGNDQFSYAWGSPQQQRYYAQALDNFGNPLNPNDAHVVNNSPASPPSDPSDLISMSHSCNSGFGTVVAWNEGSRIMYKILDNAYQFRPLGVEDVRSISSVNVYPNPASDQLFVSSLSGSIARLDIVSVLGKQVYAKEVHADKCTIDVSSFASGLYLVQVTAENGDIVQKRVLVSH